MNNVFDLEKIKKQKQQEQDNLICGVAINDANYRVYRMRELPKVNGKRKQIVEWKCPFYSVWHGVITRCYNKTLSDKYSSYSDCTVCDEWLRFSNFKAWMETQEWENKEIDKDLLGNGKLYSPQTSCFISPELNKFLVLRKYKGRFKRGVSYLYGAKKFYASINNPFTKSVEHLGFFDTEDAAYNAWLGRKHQIAKEFSYLEVDIRVIDALSTRFLNIEEHYEQYN